MRVLSLFLVTFSVLPRPYCAFAQDNERPTTNEPAPTVSATDAVKTAKNLGAAATDFLFLPGPDGKLKPVPVTGDLLDYLQWKQRDGKTEQPEFGFSSVTLNGSATDDNAELQIVVKVSLKDNQWVRIPLNLQEAVLRSPPGHEFRGNQAGDKGRSGFASYNRKDGYNWWLQGDGEHTLTLDAVVSLRKQVSERRLTVSLPTAASSQLKLTVPAAPSRVTVEKPQRIKVAPVTGGKSQLELVGLDSRFDLVWRVSPSAKPAEAALQVFSEMRLDWTDENVQLKAKQQIDALAGTFSELEVTRPAGFKVLRLKLDGAVYSLPAVDDGKPIPITLPKSTAGPVRLEWLLSASLPKDNQLKLTGLTIAKALREAGEIAIGADGGYRFKRVAGTSIHRTAVRPLFGDENVASAYLWEQPFELVLERQRVQPVYFTKSHLLVDLAEEQARLLGYFFVDVHAGALTEIVIHWPNMRQEGWKIDTVELPPDVERVSSDPKGQTVTFHLANRLVPGSAFVLPMQASRELTSPATAKPLSLPNMTSASRHRPIVAVSYDDHLEATLEATAKTPTQALSTRDNDDLLQTYARPEAAVFRERHRSAVLARSDELQFSTKVAVRPPELHADHTYQIRLAGNDVDIEQEIALRARYQRVSEIQLRVPSAVPANAQYLLDGLPVTPRWSETGAATRVARFRLPDERIGALTMTVKYHMPLPSDFFKSGEVEQTVPLLRAATSNDTTFELRYLSSDRAQFDVDAAIWTTQAPSGSYSAWTTDDPGESVRYSLKKLSRPLRATHVRDVLIRSKISHDGFSLSRADYNILEPPDTFVLTFPKSIEYLGFWLGEKKIDDAYLSIAENREGSVVLSLGDLLDSASPERRPSSIRIRVDYRSTAPSQFNWFGKHRVIAPELDDTVWVDRCVWEVVLPGDAVLLTMPRKYSSENRWGFHGTHFGRSPRFASLGGVVGDDDPNSLGGAHIYQFSRFGSAVELSFLTLSQSMLMLFGAGFSLALGLVLLKVPRSRHVLVALTLGFVAAVVSLWYLEPLKLLVQPAVLGILLAVLAVGIDSLTKRQRSGATLTFQNPTDFVAHAALVQRGHPPIGPEDPTAVRPGEPPQPAEPPSSKQTQSYVSSAHIPATE